MNSTRRAGFTLIELLTVIAIIAILAAMAFTVVPGMIERAKIRRMENALKQVSTALFAYSTDNKGASYPSAYGFINGKVPAPPQGTLADNVYFCLQPYMNIIKLHGTVSMYDEFSTSYDTNGNGRIDLLEFQPVGTKLPDGTYSLDPNLPRYDGSNNGAEVSLQMAAKQRPFIYIPVNKTQAKNAASYWIDVEGATSGVFTAETWDPANPLLANMQFPPAKYDSFVLISVGPGGNTYGLTDDPPFLASIPPQNAYHIACLRAYYLATRDLNANGELDFDYTARTKQKEGDKPYTVSVGPKGAKRDVPCDNNLPCSEPRMYGPWIFKSVQ